MSFSSSSPSSIVTPPSQSPNDGGTLQKALFKKSEVCHQCRKRKVKCDSQRPCSNCTRTYNRMIRINPHLSFAEPHCTYDSPSMTPFEMSDEAYLRNLNQLESRVEELEGLIKSADTSSSSTPASHMQTTPAPPAPALQPSSPPEHKYSIVEELTNTETFDPHPPPFALIPDAWPLDLPPKPLLLHLVDLFFTCWPNSRRILHRPTFLAQLLEPPSSPRFPFAPILHSICAVAAVHSPLVTVVPIPDLRSPPTWDIFREKTRPREGRPLMFDEEHFVISKYQCYAAARDGINLFGVAQACIINSWWALSCGRWFDHSVCCSMGMRLCNAMGLHLQDSLWKPLPNKIREKLLISPPLSHTDAELRRNVFWLAYCMERYHMFTTAWPFDISDEDIRQTLPGTLEAFEAGVDDGRERQNILSADLFTVHGDNLDDFGLYLKCSIMLSRVHTLLGRNISKYDTREQAQSSHELQTIDAIISSIRSTTGRGRFNPTEQSPPESVSNLFMAHMAPHLATLESHVFLANWSDPSCESASKALAAARSILRYASGLLSTSWDPVRLDRIASLCWASAGRALVLALKHAPESLAPVLRAEIRLVRNVLLSAGGRVILSLRQFQYLDMDILDQLGEREAGKVFQDGF